MDAQGLVGSGRRGGRIAAAVIAGGKGTRMGGVHKGLLVVHGQRIIDRQLALLHPLFHRVFIIANDRDAYANLGVDVIPDRVTLGLGPIAGIEAALVALTPDEAAVVCVAADMPFLSEQLLIALRDHVSPAPAVVPYVQSHPEPLCARYAKCALPAVQLALQQKRYKLMDLLQQLHADRLPPLPDGDEALRHFATNLNTPEDLAAIRD